MRRATSNEQRATKHSSNLLTGLRHLERQSAESAHTGRSQHLKALETFHRQLLDTCGEEPTVLMRLGASGAASEELTQVPLADYLGWFLKAASGAVYQTEAEGLRRLAAFNPGGRQNQPPELNLLPRWLSDHGPLVRAKLSLAGLSAEEAEKLFTELDQLHADLVVPILINDTLWGFIATGGGVHDGSELLYLGLYGLALVGGAERHRNGLPPKAKAQAHREAAALRELQELWVSMRPATRRIRLLIFDGEADAAAALGRFFRDWGFEVTAVSSEADALSSLKNSSCPDLILADLAPNRRIPRKFLEAVNLLAPKAALFGLTHPSNNPLGSRCEPEGLRAGCQQVFRKPFGFNGLAKVIFEAALAISVQETKPAAAEPEPKRCLVVDDEVEATLALKEYLEAKGAQVWTATNGTDALALARQVRPNLILLDLKMPGVSGTALFRQIRQAVPEAKIIVLTAWAQEYSEAELAKTLQPDAYILKPVPLASLTQLVEA